MNPRQLIPRLPALACCLGAVFTALVCKSAFAQADAVEAGGRQLQAEVMSALQARRGQWVELATGGRTVRRFVAELERREDEGAVLVDLRSDYIDETDAVTRSAVERVWLLCDAGIKRVVARRGYDLQGRPTYSTPTPDAPTQPIERLYAGTEQLICSGQYMLLEVPDGHRRLGELLLQRRAQRAAALGDRPIPAPTLQP